MLVVLGLAGAVLLLTALPWVTATTTSPLEAAVPLSVNGQEAAPAATAGALVAAAAALALSLGGRVAARLAAGGVGLGGVLVVASALAVLTDPGPRAATAAQAAVGVTTLVDGPHRGAAVAVAIGAGTALVLLGGLALVAAGGWATSDTRHRTPGAGAGPSGAGAGPVRPVPAAEDGLDDRDTWDALSRGEDPT